jgi:segregation and condensation protein A
MEQGRIEFESDAYQVHTPKFEGPLDLLLHLIRKKRMDILDISLSEITAEYLRHLEDHRGINPSREGEFLMTAATLIYIKSRSLLPRLGNDPDDSPEQRLLYTLVEYDKVQKISNLLKEMETDTLLLWRRDALENTFSATEYDIEEVTSFQLAELFINLVKRQERDQVMTITKKNYSIDSKKKEILTLLDQEGYLNFTKYLASLSEIEDLLVSFFTLLELVKQKQVSALQKKLFADIDVWPKADGAVYQ